MCVIPDKGDLRAWKIQYYDRKNLHLETLTFGKYRKFPGRFWQSHEITVVNHQTGKSTVLRWKAYKVPHQSQGERIHANRPQTGALMTMRVALRCAHVACSTGAALSFAGAGQLRRPERDVQLPAIFCRDTSEITTSPSGAPSRSCPASTADHGTVHPWHHKSRWRLPPLWARSPAPRLPSPRKDRSNSDPPR